MAQFDKSYDPQDITI